MSCRKVSWLMGQFIALCCDSCMSTTFFTSMVWKNTSTTYPHISIKRWLSRAPAELLGACSVPEVGQYCQVKGTRHLNCKVLFFLPSGSSIMVHDVERLLFFTSLATLYWRTFSDVQIISPWSLWGTHKPESLTISSLSICSILLFASLFSLCH